MAFKKSNFRQFKTFHKEKLSPKHREIREREYFFAITHKEDSDENLLQYLRNIANELGRLPTKKDVEGYVYLKSRFGPWPRILEQAGLKEPSPRRKPDKNKQSC